MEILVDIKPTFHVQFCKTCRVKLRKGEVRVTIMSRSYRNTDKVFFHPKCLTEYISKEARIQGGFTSISAFDWVNPSRRDDK